MTPAELIRAARQRAGLSQGRFAALLGVTQSAVSRWESGSRPVSAELAASLAAGLAPVMAACDPTARTARARQVHEGNAAYRREEYAWLRDGGEGRQMAGLRLGLTTVRSVLTYERRYQGQERTA